MKRCNYPHDNMPYGESSNGLAYLALATIVGLFLMLLGGSL